MLLKVHRIPRPVTVRVRDEHHGCHSWVEIDRDLSFEGVPLKRDPVRSASQGIVHVPEGRGIIAPLTVHENLITGADST